ncbi:MAG TPA: putative glycoside hydrolase [Firmicutes bacterium]|nr:putative glycoside hydrolase [Bacillota bacterium]
MTGRYAKGYRSHRGRRRGSPVLKAIVVVLLLLLVASVLFVVVLGRYVEYTDAGVRLNLPWMQEPEPGGPVVTDPVVVLTQTPPPSQPAPAQEQVGAVELTPRQLADGTAAQAVAQAGGNALVVEMKGLSGALAWVSQSDRAAELGVNAQDGQVAQAVADLAQAGEIHLVARVSCFRDQALASAGVGGPLMTRGGNIWYDSAGYRWVSPASEQVREYLTELCVELAQMGFDEILLEAAGFPGLGETHVLATSENRPEDRSAPVEGFLEQLTQALSGTGATLSILAGEETVLGRETLTGLTPELLAEYAGRVWAVLPVQGEEAYVQVLEQAGMEEARQRLVSLGGARPDGSWTTLDELGGSET